MKPGAASPFPLAALVTMQKGAISTEEIAKLDSRENEQLPPNQERKGEGLRRMPRLPLTTSELIVVLCIFGMFSIALLCIYITMPSVDHKLLKLPRTVSELRTLTYLGSTIFFCVCVHEVALYIFLCHDCNRFSVGCTCSLIVILIKNSLEIH